MSLAISATAVVPAFDQDVSPGRSSPRRADGPLVTVRTPQPEQFELAMDEVDMEADRTAGATDAPPAPRAVPSTAIMTSSDGRATLRVSGASSTQDLLSISVALEAANPGSRVSWVLYPPEAPRTASTRVQLTREVGLLLEDNAQNVLADLRNPRAVPGVPNGFVVEASDPRSALDLVETLRERPGVRTAYSLIRRQQSPR